LEKVSLVIDDWSGGVYWPTSRRGKEFKGVSQEYVRNVAGHFSGAMARLNPENPSLGSMLNELKDYGSGLEAIQKEAENKAEVYLRG
jgi:hypothetical protein